MLQSILGQLNTSLNNTGLTSAETGALNTLESNAALGNPYAGQIGNYANELLSGGGATNQAGAVNQNYLDYRSAADALCQWSMIGNNPALAAQLAQIQADVTNQVNGQFAAAGRDFSGANANTLGRGIAAGTAPVIAAQYNQDVANQRAAQDALYAAGNTNAGTLMGSSSSVSTTRARALPRPVARSTPTTMAPIQPWQRRRSAAASRFRRSACSRRSVCPSPASDTRRTEHRRPRSRCPAHSNLAPSPAALASFLVPANSLGTKFTRPSDRRQGRHRAGRGIVRWYAGLWLPLQGCAGLSHRPDGAGRGKKHARCGDRNQRLQGGGLSRRHRSLATNARGRLTGTA